MRVLWNFTKDVLKAVTFSAVAWYIVKGINWILPEL